MNRKKRLIILLIILLLCTGGYLGYRYATQQNQTLTLYGNVDIRTVNLSFRVSGRLASLSVDEGDSIQVGQELGKLEDTPYRHALQQAQANVAAQKAAFNLLQAGYRQEVIAQANASVQLKQTALEYAERFYQRQAALWSKKAVSKNELDTAKTQRDQARSDLQAARDLLTQYRNGNRPEEIEQGRAALQQAEATLAQAELNLNDTRLVAPASGVLMTRALEPGSMLNAGSTVLTLSLTEPVWIRAYVSEPHLGRVAPGTLVKVFTDGRPNQPYHAKVGFVSPTAEFTPKSVETPDLRTDLVYRLRLIVTDPDPALRQGMPVTLAFVD